MAEEKNMPETVETPVEETSENREHHHHHHHDHHHSGKHSKHRKSKHRKKKFSLKNKPNLIVNIVVILIAIMVVLAIWLLEVPAPGRKDPTPSTGEPSGNEAQITTSTMQLEVPYFANEVCLIHSSARAFANANVELPVAQVADQYKSEVNKVADEYFSNVLLGKTTLSDADWEAYLAKLNAAGLDKIIADYESLLK